MIDSLAIFGATYLFVLPLIVAGIYVYNLEQKMRRKLCILGFVSFPLIFLVALIARHLYDDPRPFVAQHFTPLIPHDPDNGFPSDHTLIVAAIAAVITTHNRRIGATLWGVVLLVGLSRVYVGVHHFIDITASMVIAACVVMATDYALKKYVKGKLESAVLH